MAGLALFGVVFYVLCLWYVGDDQRLQRVAESRWWLDRHVVWRVRRGRVSRDEWFKILAIRQRRLVKWGFGAATVLWVLACGIGLANAFQGVD